MLMKSWTNSRRSRESALHRSRPSAGPNGLSQLQETIARIRNMPRVHKPYGRLDGELVWRMMTASTRLHVYYTIDETHDVAHIEYVWGTRRGQVPPFDE